MYQKTYKQVSIRVDTETLEKLRSIAKQETRSVSRQVLYWIRRAIEQYEKPQETPGQV